MLEVLLYLAIVKHNAPALNAGRIFHRGETPFDWQEVAASGRVAVLANPPFFQAALTRDGSKVPALRDRVRQDCDVEVLFFQTADYALTRRPDAPQVPCFAGVAIPECHRLF